MINRAKAGLIGVAVTLSACSPIGARADGHFTCAAMIGAADRLMATGEADADETIARDGLVAGMAHLNAWAISSGLPEREAFDRVSAERDRLAATLKPSEIVERAKACIASA